MRVARVGDHWQLELGPLLDDSRERISKILQTLLVDTSLPQPVE